MTEKKKSDADPDPAKAASKLVRVRVIKAINISGLVIRPKVDDSGRGKGSPAKVQGVEAIITRAMAESYGERYVQIIGDAPAKAKIGVAAK